MSKDRLFESSELAIANAVSLSIEAKSKWVLVSDIDDTLLVSFEILLGALNDHIKKLDPAWEKLTLTEIDAIPSGRLDDSRAADALVTQGLDFMSVWTEICSDYQINSNMNLIEGARDFIDSLSALGVPLIAYLTARPKEVYKATNDNFNSLKLPAAPILGPGSNLGNTAEDKMTLLAAIANQLPENIKIFFADDHVPTILKIKAKLGERVEVLAIATTLNSKVKAQLIDSQISYGSYTDHLWHIRKLIDSTSQGYII